MQPYTQNTGIKDVLHFLNNLFNYFLRFSYYSKSKVVEQKFFEELRVYFSYDFLINLIRISYANSI
jgi:hypothetical protein